MRFGKVALLITIAAATLHCSGNPPVSEPGQAGLNAPSAVFIQSIDHAATPSGTQVVLHGNFPFNFTSYQPDSRTLVVELLDVQIDGLSDQIEVDTPQVDGILVSNLQSIDGGNIAKFEFQNVVAGRHAIHLDGNDLVVDFPSLSNVDNLPDPPIYVQEGAEDDLNADLMTFEGEDDEAFFDDEGEFDLAEMEPMGGEGDAAMFEGTDDDAMAPLSMDDEFANLDPLTDEAAPLMDADGSDDLPAIDTLEQSAQDEARAPQAGTTIGASGLDVMQGERPAGAIAQELLSVEATGEAGATRIVLNADGGLVHEHFELNNPMRLVVDLIGVYDRTGQNSIPVTSDVVSKVRVAQFVSLPNPVARVVLDMKTPQAYAMVLTDRGLVIDFSPEAAEMAALAVPQPAAADAPVQEAAVEQPVDQIGGPLAAEEPPAAQPTMIEPPSELLPEYDTAGEQVAKAVIPEPVASP